MFEPTLIIPCRDARHSPLTRDVGECVTPRQFRTLVGEASALFAGQISRGVNSENVASWLTRSPCHGCAWRRVTDTWNLLGEIPTNA